MQGDGIDMYDLITDLIDDELESYLTDEFVELCSTDQKFWVGVLEGKYPSPPIPRRKTKCYAPAPVYIFFGEYVFSMDRKSENGTWVKDFYVIPENEMKFVARYEEVNRHE